MLLCCLQRLRGHAIVQTDARERAEPLRLDEDLPFLTFFRSNLVSEIVIGAQKPLSVPAVFADRVFHLLDFGKIFLRFRFCFGAFSGTAMRGTSLLNRDVRKLATCETEQTRNENRLGNFAFFVGGRLKGLPWRIGEAVQVQAIIPVGTPNQRQAVGAESIERVLKAALQVLIKRRFRTWLVVVRHRLAQDAPVAGLL